MAMALLVGLIVLVRVTREYAWNYTHAPIVAGGYPMEAKPPAAHVAMEQEQQNRPPALVQILPTSPAGTLGRRSPGCLSRACQRENVNFSSSLGKIDKPSPLPLVKREQKAQACLYLRCFHGDPHAQMDSPRRVFPSPGSGVLRQVFVVGEKTATADISTSFTPPISHSPTRN